MIPILATALAAVAVLSGEAVAGGRAVKVGDNYFFRQGGATVTVKRGTTVTWSWRGLSSHNVTVRRGPVKFHSRTQSAGTFARRLTKPGLYTIICTIHGPAMSMKLRVT